MDSAETAVRVMTPQLFLAAMGWLSIAQDGKKGSGGRVFTFKVVLMRYIGDERADDVWYDSFQDFGRGKRRAMSLYDL